jgi:hypothetical protein
MSCNKCNRQKESCSCRKKIPICKEPEHKCHESELYRWCDKEDPCHETTCKTECVVQIDAKEVFYKLKGDCFSEMSFLDIPKGADLEYILERFATFIENFSYFDVTPNKYGATDLKSYMDALTLDVKLTQECCNNKQAEIDLLKQEITAIKLRLSDIEKPKIVDTRGLGFTNNSTLKEVIQILANKP